uniref:DUF3016 domain-containing protein n=1 Tax=Ningiella ruwaisensis TaxID=2364274 RepID=UPI0010A03876|nr:DUF3016 domain-containing protein [Ningiella ruwaisensis]
MKSKLIPLIGIVALSNVAFSALAGEDDKSDIQTIEQSSEKLNIAFVAPKKYTDIRPSNQTRSKFREHVTDSFYEMFDDLAQTLPDGQTLDVTVTDIDLAGDTRSPRIPINMLHNDIRVLEDIYFPRVKFSYQLKDASGAVLMSDDVELKDMNYLDRAGFVRHRYAFPYEHQMIEEWFDKTFTQQSQS